MTATRLLHATIVAGSWPRAALLTIAARSRTRGGRPYRRSAAVTAITSARRTRTPIAGPPRTDAG